MRRTWTRLEQRQAPIVWARPRPSFLSQERFGDLPAEVAAGTVADPGRKTRIEVDVAVLSAGLRVNHAGSFP
jgi:hypothetical protein